jgi:hypothetical protein
LVVAAPAIEASDDVIRCHSYLFFQCCQHAAKPTTVSAFIDAGWSRPQPNAEACSSGPYSNARRFSPMRLGLKNNVFREAVVPIFTRDQLRRMYCWIAARTHQIA